MPVIYFVAGLPRAGSTLLLNLLAQNPAHHVTATNGLLPMFGIIRDNWTKWDHFRAQGIEAVRPRIAAALRGMTYGFYEKELSRGQAVFDKNRSWTGQIELLEEVFQREIRVICPVRDVKAIIASFERRYRDNPLVRHAFPPGQGNTIGDRAAVWCSPAGLVGSPAALMRDAIERGLSNRLVIIPYAQLATEPRETLSRLHNQLGLPPFPYDPDHVEQVTQEDDGVHGWGPGLHLVRSKVEPPATAPWKGLLPPVVCQRIDADFPDINALASGQPLPM